MVGPRTPNSPISLIISLSKVSCLFAMVTRGNSFSCKIKKTRIISFKRKKYNDNDSQYILRVKIMILKYINSDRWTNMMEGRECFYE